MGEAVDPVGANVDARPVDLATPQITPDDVAAVTRVLESGWLTSGSECRALEEELGDYLGVPHVVAVASCTAAMDLAFAYLELPPGSRVGVPTWTFVASAFSPVHHGAEIVLLDSDPDTMNVSVESLTAALDEGLAAVVGVHFGGSPLPWAVHELCAERGVPLVEDAAHAFGAWDHRGRLDGSGSVAAAFSFYATKNLTSGEGGALATDDERLDRFARAYRLHGLTQRPGTPWNPDVNNDIVGPGMKANLSDILAALARSQLRRFDLMQTRRRQLVERYRKNLARVDGVEVLPRTLTEGNANHLMVVVLPAGANRRLVFDRLAADRITTSLHFRPLHHHDWFQAHASIGPTGTAVADDMANRALSLPLHTGLADQDVDRVCAALEHALT